MDDYVKKTLENFSQQVEITAYGQLTLSFIDNFGKQCVQCYKKSPRFNDLNAYLSSSENNDAGKIMRIFDIFFSERCLVSGDYSFEFHVFMINYIVLHRKSLFNYELSEELNRYLFSYGFSELVIDQCSVDEKIAIIKDMTFFFFTLDSTYLVNMLKRNCIDVDPWVKKLFDLTRGQLMLCEISKMTKKTTRDLMANLLNEINLLIYLRMAFIFNRSSNIFFLPEEKEKVKERIRRQTRVIQKNMNVVGIPVLETLLASMQNKMKKMVLSQVFRHFRSIDLLLYSKKPVKRMFNAQLNQCLDMLKKDQSRIRSIEDRLSVFFTCHHAISHNEKRLGAALLK